MRAARRKTMLRFGAAIRDARAELGMSQEEVAYAAGVAVSTYARLERPSSAATANPTVGTLARISHVLGMDLNVVTSAPLVERKNEDS